jgi:hypothetical protein
VEFITNYVDLGVETTVTSTGTKMAVGAVPHTPHTSTSTRRCISAAAGMLRHCVCTATLTLPSYSPCTHRRGRSTRTPC